MKALKISKDISLPLDVVTNTIAILAKRRAGKSYTMRRIVEELLEMEQQVVMVDPKGDQWGIRSSADGKKAGYPIVILGGEHGDVPLEVNAGEVVAKLVVEDRVSVLLDLSTFRKHEISTFMAIFLENLYRLKAQERYRTPVMLVVDEADAIAPQKPQKGEERMLGAIEDIVRRGGQRGIGCILVTQRSAVLNKNVLTQAQMLVVLRTIAPQDISAMKAWIDVHGTVEQGRELIESLPSLPIGDAWFWSPGWPDPEKGIFKRSHVLPIRTFDSGATPKPGERKVIPKNLADVNLDVLKKQMAATIEKAKNDDPKELKKRIASLERALSTKQPAIVNQSTTKQDIEKALEPHLIAIASERNAWKLLLDQWMEYARMLKTTAVNAGLALTNDLKKLPEPSTKPGGTYSGKMPLPKIKAPEEGSVRQTQPLADRGSKGESGYLSPATGVFDGDFRPSRSQQAILNALAFLEGIGISEADKTQVALFADQSPTSGGYFKNMGELKANGFVDYPRPALVSLTPAGRSLAKSDDIPSSNEELHEQLFKKLSSSQVALLKVLIRIYPETISKNDLAAEAEQRATSGGYFKNLGVLRALKLIDYPSPGVVVAQKVLFIN